MKRQRVSSDNYSFHHTPYANGLFSRGKLINDPIHSYIPLDALTLKFIDTPQFQRLRSLKQLGAAFYVFPGASHTRFEHSIGVCHLADSLVTRLKNQQPELDISEREINCIKIAGLCHDLGHGPFSHLFDNEFIPAVCPGLDWSHEEGSNMMLEYLIDDNYIDVDECGLDVSFIKNLISGDSKTPREQERQFLFDIVANKRNSIDVDKFDYIQRDCYNLNHPSSYDCSRLLNFNRVINNRICFEEKEIYTVYELFHTRYSLFKQIYTHRAGKAVEYMITDALIAANPYLKISDAIQNPEEYIRLNDSLLSLIQFSKDENLKPAQEILHRLQKRDMYSFVSECLLTSELALNRKNYIKPSDIIQHQPDGAGLTENDVIVEWFVTNYGMKDRNPVNEVEFYNKMNPYDSFLIPRERVTFLVPENFQETKLRIFSRDKSKAKSVKEAFKRFQSRELPSACKPWTPTNSPRKPVAANPIL